MTKDEKEDGALQEKKAQADNEDELDFLENDIDDEDIRSDLYLGDELQSLLDDEDFVSESDGEEFQSGADDEELGSMLDVDQELESILGDEEFQTEPEDSDPWSELNDENFLLEPDDEEPDSELDDDAPQVEIDYETLKDVIKGGEIHIVIDDGDFQAEPENHENLENTRQSEEPAENEEQDEKPVITLPRKILAAIAAAFVIAISTILFFVLDTDTTNEAESVATVMPIVAPEDDTAVVAETHLILVDVVPDEEPVLLPEQTDAPAETPDLVDEVFVEVEEPIVIAEAAPTVANNVDPIEISVGATAMSSESTGNAFIIVGSFTDGNRARQNASAIVKRGESPVIIPPFGNSSAYRVAIAKYETRAEAQSSLQSYRDEYGDDSWILEYQAPVAVTMLGERTGSTYVIFSSFTNEDQALKQANILAAREISSMIVPPFGQSGNYRVAIASYATLAEAQAALAQHRRDHGEDVWLLRY
jgi:hypothetical protein